MRFLAEPALIVFYREDQRHPIMDLADQFVRSSGDHCKRAHPFHRKLGLASFPNAANPEPSIFHRNRERLLCLRAFDGHPLVEAVDRKNAATISISIPKR